MTVELAAVIRGVDLAGVLANAVLGGSAARVARLDAVGFVVLAVMSGLGGGMIRDVLLQQGTVAALRDPRHLLAAALGAAAAYLIPVQGRTPRRTLVLLDALSLGCWANAGTQLGLTAGLALGAAVLLGMTTAVGGGMVRDVLLRRVPTVFGGNPLYATSALLACLVTVAFSVWGQAQWGSAVAILAGAGPTLASRRYGWRLPVGGAPPPELTLPSAGLRLSRRRPRPDRQRRPR